MANNISNFSGTNSSFSKQDYAMVFDLPLTANTVLLSLHSYMSWQKLSASEYITKAHHVSGKACTMMT